MLVSGRGACARCADRAYGTSHENLQLLPVEQSSSWDTMHMTAEKLGGFNINLALVERISFSTSDCLLDYTLLTSCLWKPRTHANLFKAFLLDRTPSTICLFTKIVVAVFLRHVLLKIYMSYQNFIKF